MKRRGGFTLVEMLVVVVIITILAGGSVMLMNNLFRGQGVRQGGLVVIQAVAQARQMAAATRKIHFLVFSAANQDGWLEIHEDTNGDGIYQGDQDPKTPDSDKMVMGHRADLPQFVVFDLSPAWVGFQPSGYLTMYNSSGGLHPDVPASAFDMILGADPVNGDPAPIGDVVLGMQNQTRSYKMCMDLDRASGKVRRHFFLAKEKP
jgi:prepilin-type N-terminal cleavage/methylation domain-containing protein